MAGHRHPGERRAAAEASGVTLQEHELTAQFRCAGSLDYLRWLDSTLGLGGNDEANLANSEYQFEVVPNPSDLREFINERNLRANKSRLLAGYCWDWVSKKDASRYDITFDEYGFAMKWNLTEDGSTWMISPTSVNEVGCIHTCQGLEGDFMGVIIGDDLEVVDGQLRGNPFNRSTHDKSLKGFKKAYKVDPASALHRADILIRNTYRTLLTRGMLGTSIYCTNPEVANYFRNRLQK